MASKVIVIGGSPASGKTRSFKDIPDQQNWIYFNCEAGKMIPFNHSFKEITISDPDLFYQLINKLSLAFKNEDQMKDILKSLGMKQIDGIIVDSVSMLMEQWISKNITNTTDDKNGFKKWALYSDFFARIMQDHISKYPVPVVLTFHYITEENSATNEVSVKLALKGDLGKTGAEKYFSFIMTAKKIPLEYIEEREKEIKDLFGKYENNLLTISPEEKLDGVKYVLQTRYTKNSIGEKIRSLDKFFKIDETYIDNDLSKVLEKLKTYYGNK